MEYSHAAVNRNNLLGIAWLPVNWVHPISRFSYYILRHSHPYFSLRYYKLEQLQPQTYSYPPSPLRTKFSLRNELQVGGVQPSPVSGPSIKMALGKNLQQGIKWGFGIMGSGRPKHGPKGLDTNQQRLKWLFISFRRK